MKHFALHTAFGVVLTTLFGLACSTDSPKVVSPRYPSSSNAFSAPDPGCSWQPTPAMSPQTVYDPGTPANSSVGKIAAEPGAPTLAPRIPVEAQPGEELLYVTVEAEGAEVEVGVLDEPPAR